MVNEYPQVLDIIQPNVMKLVLQLDVQEPLEDRSILVSYLDRMNQQSQLRELDIHCMNVDDIAPVLDAIPRLDHLQRLMLFFGTHFNWDPYDMECFFDALAKGCPRLACLEIRFSNGPLIGAIKALKQLESLKQFAFGIQHISDDDDEFWEAIEELSQLECIRIYSASQADMDRIRYLKIKRPGLEVIVDAMLTRS